MSNLFMRIAGAWVTPDLSQCGVQGVMRDLLIERVQQEGGFVQVRTVGYDELLSADGDRHWPVGPFTRQMQSLAKQVYL